MAILAAAWQASDRGLWPFTVAGVVVGCALLAAYRFIWYRPSGHRNRYRNTALLVGAAAGPLVSSLLQAALGRNVVQAPAMFCVGFFVGGLIVVAIRPWTSGRSRRLT